MLPLPFPQTKCHYKSSCHLLPLCGHSLLKFILLFNYNSEICGVGQQ